MTDTQVPVLVEVKINSFFLINQKSQTSVNGSLKFTKKILRVNRLVRGII